MDWESRWHPESAVIKFPNNASGVAPSSVEVLAQSRGNIPSFGAEVRFLRLPQYLN